MRPSQPAGFFADVSSFTWAHWLGVLFSLGIVVINGWLGYREDAVTFLLIAASFLFGLGVFFTRYWNSAFYLVGVLHSGVVFVLWVLDGFQFRTLGLLNGALTIGLALIAIYLFMKEEEATRALKRTR